MVEVTTRTKTAIITGGGQGIGKAITRHFLVNGFRVVIAEIDQEAGTETQRELEAMGPVRFIRTDVADESSVRAMAARVMDEHHSVDVLINNAGIMISKSVTDLSLAEWNRVLGTNLTAQFLCVKYCAAALKASRGSIVNIASTRALMSEPDTESYSASKSGTIALTHALAVSLGPDVRVNCISPGWIDVGAWKKASIRRETELSAADHGQHPAGRVGKPEDIAAMALYLASEESSFITGQNFVIDGGMTRKMIYV